MANKGWRGWLANAKKASIDGPRLFSRPERIGKRRTAGAAAASPLWARPAPTARRGSPSKAPRLFLSASRGLAAAPALGGLFSRRFEGAGPDPCFPVFFPTARPAPGERAQAAPRRFAPSRSQTPPPKMRHWIGAGSPPIGPIGRSSRPRDPARRKARHGAAARPVFGAFAPCAMIRQAKTRSTPRMRRSRARCAPQSPGAKPKEETWPSQESCIA